MNRLPSELHHSPFKINFKTQNHFPNQYPQPQPALFLPDLVLVAAAVAVSLVFLCHTSLASSLHPALVDSGPEC